MTEVIVEGRRERKKRELRTRIYETARLLFLEQGFEATTVAQIAEAADIAQATFFNHFPNKQAVLGEMTSEVSLHLLRLVDEQLARPISALERIHSFAESVAEEVNEARGLAREVVLELMGTSTRRGEPHPYLARVHGPFTAIIREGQEQGDVRRDRDADFLTEMVLGCLNVAVSHWIADPDYPLAQSLREIAEFVNEAIQSQPREGEPPVARR